MIARGTNPKPEVTLNACGGMRLMSVEEPEPGAVGLTSVVSMSVQPSPLKPHFPNRTSAIAYFLLSLIAARTNLSAGT